MKIPTPSTTSTCSVVTCHSLSAESAWVLQCKHSLHPRYQIKIPLGNPVVLYSKKFYNALGSIVCVLSNEAGLAPSGSIDGYTVKQKNASGTVTLYGFTQCTSDLSTGDYNRCVVVVAVEFPKLGQIITLESLQFDLATIEGATNNFSQERGIGKGGYEEDYKVILIQRGSNEGSKGVYSIKSASTKQDQGDDSYTFAFEDQDNANNFCFLLESF
ncbi:hypothetical protein RJT34_07035 [Clitoria ternatea]|uniref:Uncharacterized protein n=1 Tax=Clitoria ternatea TaxID=43366 RepID=A0AAN9K317_CLITE